VLATLPRPGSPRAALAHRPFRWVFSGSFASNIGTWMQNVVLLSFADELTSSATFVGLVTLAQLGPTLVLSPFGGVLADRFDRRRIMMVSAAFQGLLSLALAAVAHQPQPSRTALVLCVLGIGIASSATAPSATASLPALVGHEDLPGAVALNSAQMNASRVLGPVLATLPFLHTPWIAFAVNAATYLFVIVAVAVAPFDGRPAAAASTEGPWRRFLGGVEAARGDRVVRRVLVTVSVLSFGSLAFIYQMKGFARTELGIGAEGFPRLFGTFGLGAAIGAMSVGTLLAHLPRSAAVRAGLVGFAGSLSAFTLVRWPVGSYLAVALTGFTYFVVITSLSTALQQAVADRVRGRVMGLWMMGWAGLVPVGSFAAGLAIDEVGHTPVMLVGAAVALALAGYADIAAEGGDGHRHRVAVSPRRSTPRPGAPDRPPGSP